MADESSPCSRRAADPDTEQGPDVLSRIATVGVVALIIGIVISTLAPTPEHREAQSSNPTTRTTPWMTSSTLGPDRTSTSQRSTTSANDTTSSSAVPSSRATTSTRKPSVALPTPTTHRHSNTTQAPAATVGNAGTPTTVPAHTGGGSHAGGTFCNGWIRRAPAASHLTVYDTTGGRAPTASDCANARAFYNAAVSANAKFADIKVALANNYKPGSDAPSNVARHYVYWGPRPGVASATAPEGLVYRFDSAGKATLIGIYFYEKAGTHLSQPGGPLTVWHSHTPTSARMLHVWTFPGTRDPFAFMLSGA